jgi:phage terminase Nu1 subunit (DNA packaging protein)
VTEDVVNTATLARYLTLTPRRIQQMAAEGKLPKFRDEEGNEIDGRWHVPTCITAYVATKSQALRTEEELDIDVQIQGERLKKIRADASIREIDLEYRQGTLFRSEHVGQVLDSLFGSFHTRLQAVPLTMARDVAGMTDLNKIADVLRTGINEAEEELRRFCIEDLRRFNQQFLAEQAARETINPQVEHATRQDS